MNYDCFDSANTNVYGDPMSGIKVWIDQDLCTGDGSCEEIAPAIFFGAEDGLYYVREAGTEAPTEPTTVFTNLSMSPTILLKQPLTQLRNALGNVSFSTSNSR